MRLSYIIYQMRKTHLTTLPLQRASGPQRPEDSHQANSQNLQPLRFPHVSFLFVPELLGVLANATRDTMLNLEMEITHTMEGSEIGFKISFLKTVALRNGNGERNSFRSS
jgi:hypothetical protein